MRSAARLRSAAPVRLSALALLLVVVVASAATASDTGLSGDEGHPRSQLPLALYVAPLLDATLEGSAKRAIDDWNAVSQAALGVQAFRRVDRDAGAQVIVTFAPAPSPRMMGETSLETGTGGRITPPVRIRVFDPTARGQTARETLLYQVLGHELGHALGLAHVTNPASIMCCVRGSIDFNDPAARDAYLAARRQPDVRSVRGEIAAHYETFWTQHR